ncbi:MAG: copper resistance protein NlpE [Bacteroides sp.]|nr:copper resistance protein NlpE [Bacteroides sp.]
MKKILFIACAGFALASCGQKAQQAQTEAMDSTKVAVEQVVTTTHVGTYKGVLPAADAAGIETKLTLNADMTFAKSETYLEKGESFESTGTYSVENDLVTLTDANGEISYLRLEEGAVRLLNADKEAVTGELADKYVLVKE